MELIAIKLNDPEKCIGGTMHIAYRCPKCNKKFWRMYVSFSASCPGCKTQLKLQL